MRLSGLKGLSTHLPLPGSLPARPGLAQIVPRGRVHPVQRDDEPGPYPAYPALPMRPRALLPTMNELVRDTNFGGPILLSSRLHILESGESDGSPS